MGYKEFLEYVCNKITNVLSKEGEEGVVSIHKVIKNNDIELDALIVKNETTNISPTIYLNQYYNELKGGKSIEDICKEIYLLYNEHKEEFSDAIPMFGDFQEIRQRVVYKLIHCNKNQKLLHDVPYIPFLDLAIVFYFIVDNSVDRKATVLIRNEHISTWSISVDELFQRAKENTVKLLPAEINTMENVIKTMLVNEMKQENVMNSIVREESYYETAVEERFAEINNLDEEIKMYIPTNKHKLNGAACILYDGVLENFANKINRDIFILPSSIHEVILVPVVDSIKKQELTDMVREVNSEAVEEGEILSDHVYIYRRNLRKICI